MICICILSTRLDYLQQALLSLPRQSQMSSIARSFLDTIRAKIPKALASIPKQVLPQEAQQDSSNSSLLSRIMIYHRQRPLVIQNLLTSPTSFPAYPAVSLSTAYYHVLQPAAPYHRRYTSPIPASMFERHSRFQHRGRPCLHKTTRHRGLWSYGLPSTMIISAVCGDM